MNEPNNFVRTLIVLFAVALAAMVFVSFSFSEPPYEISGGILTVLFLIAILVLSESFNNLSLGRVLSLSREVEKKQSENTRVKEENKELRHQLFKIVSNVQQSQVNNTYNAPSDEWLKLLGVVKAKDSEPDEDQKEQEENQQVVNYVAEQARRREQNQARHKRWKVSEDLAIEKYAESLSVPESEVIKGAVFSQAFDEIDPIMSRRINFDGYIKGANLERFIEVRPKSSFSPMFQERLYVMLNKIFLYRKAKGISAELILLIVEFEGDEEDQHQTWRLEKFYEYFQPAISNRLLKVEHLKLTEEEVVEAESRGQQRLF